MPAADDALPAIARRLFAQLHATGRLAAALSIDGDRFDAIVLPRLVVLGRLVALLAPATPLDRIAPGETTIDNGHAWPAGAAPGGALAAVGVPPAAHVESYFAAWREQTNAPPKTFAGRVVRAALGVERGSNVVDAIGYVVDLHACGFVLSAEALTLALVALLGRLDVDAGLDAALDALLERTEGEVERVRAAACYDDWLTGQALLMPLIGAVRAVFAELGRADELPFLAPLGRLDEIRADAGSLMLMTGLRGKSVRRWPYEADFGSISPVARALQAEVPDWRERLLSDRLVVPTALVRALLDDHLPAAALPEPWRAVSATLAPVFGPGTLGDPRYPLRRREPLAAREYAASAQTEATFARHGVSDPGARGALVDLLCDTVDDPADTWPLFADAVSKRRLHALRERGFSDAAVAAVLVDLFYDACAADAAGRVERVDAGPPAGWSAQLALVRESYPWLDGVVARQAALLVAAGDLDPACDLVADLIVRQPDEPQPWEMLSEILERAGRSDQAGFAASLASGLRRPTESSAPAGDAASVSTGADGQGVGQAKA